MTWSAWFEYDAFVFLHKTKASLPQLIVADRKALKLNGSAEWSASWLMADTLMECAYELSKRLIL